MNILQVNRNVIKIVFMQFIISLNLYRLIWSVIYEEKGFDIVQIGFLFSCYYGTKMILEVPSGILADKYSKKKILLLSELLIGIYLYVLFNVSNAVVNIAGMMILGCAYAFVSGTLDAYEYDIVTLHHETAYKTVNAIERMLNYVAFGISYLAGGFLNDNKQLLFIFSECIVLVGIIILSSLEETEKRIVGYNIKKYCKQIVENSILQETLVISSIIAITMIPIENYIVFIMQDIGISVKFVSIYEVLVYMLSSIVAFSVVRKYKVNFVKVVFIVLIVGMSFSYNGKGRLLSYMIIMILIAIIQPFRTEEMQKNIMAESRTMFLSIESIVISVSGIVGQNIFSVVMKKFGISLATICIFLIGTCIYYMLVWRKRSETTFFNIRWIQRNS